MPTRRPTSGRPTPQPRPRSGPTSHSGSSGGSRHQSRGDRGAASSTAPHHPAAGPPRRRHGGRPSAATDRPRPAACSREPRSGAPTCRVTARRRGIDLNGSYIEERTGSTRRNEWPDINSTGPEPASARESPAEHGRRQGGRSKAHTAPTAGPTSREMAEPPQIPVGRRRLHPQRPSQFGEEQIGLWSGCPACRRPRHWTSRASPPLLRGMT